MLEKCCLKTDPTLPPKTVAILERCLFPAGLCSDYAPLHPPVVERRCRRALQRVTDLIDLSGRFTDTEYVLFLIRNDRAYFTCFCCGGQCIFERLIPQNGVIECGFCSCRNGRSPVAIACAAA